MSNDGSIYEWSVLSNELETGYCGTCCCIKWQCALFLHHITLINNDLYLFVILIYQYYNNHNVCGDLWNMRNMNIR